MVNRLQKNEVKVKIILLRIKMKCLLGREPHNSLDWREFELTPIGEHALLK